MKHLKIILSGLLILVAQEVKAQGYGGPLTFQGVNHTELHSVVARGMGGIAFRGTPDAASMFNQPAALERIRGLQLSVAGWWFSERLEQEQNYAPVRYYPNLSLLLEGLTGKIPEPNPNLPGFTPADTVQRPYDDIGPNWTHSDNWQRPLHLMMAMPVTLGQLNLAAGAGVVAHADLHHYYQNNNVLYPSILSQRPLPTPRPTDDNPLPVQWYQTTRSREGAIWGYGFALAGTWDDKPVAFGVSGLLLRGSSDDFEQQVGRGRLTFFSNAFRADSAGWRLTRTGSSDFRGYELNIGAVLSGRHVSLGLSVKPPSEIKRSYRTEQISLPQNLPAELQSALLGMPMDGEDRLRLPWRGTVALSVVPKERLVLAFEYEVRPYKSAKYVDARGIESSPWLSSSPFRVGVECGVTPWLTLRGGMRSEAEVFEPEGNHLPGEPATYTAYALGLGIARSGFRFDLALEHWEFKYQDIWSSAISKNVQKGLVVLGQVTYELASQR